MSDSQGAGAGQDVSGITPLDYAAWRSSRLGATTERLERNAVLDLAGPVHGLRVLDVGCGDGTYAVAAAAAGARVVGLDRSEPALRVTRAVRAPTAVHVAVGDAATLPFRDSAFDLVVAVTVLCFVRSAADVVSEMRRVLRPGGALVIGELGRWSSWAAWRRVRGWLGAPAWSRARFRSARELRALLAAHGFAVERVRGVAFHPPVGSIARWSAPLDPVLGRITTLGAAFVALRATRVDRAA